MNISLIRGFETAPAIDAAKIKELFNAIREVSGSLDVEFDLSLHESVEALFTTSVSAGDGIRSGLVRLRALLMANSFKTTLKARLEKADARDTPQKRESAAAIVWQYIGREVNGFCGSMEQVADSLTEAALSMERLNLSARPATVLARLKMETHRLNASLAKKTQHQVKLLEDRKVLDDTIAALDKLEWKDLSAVLPTAEEIELVSANPTQRELLLLGLKRLGQLVETFDGRIKYVDAVRVRDELRADQERARDSIRQLNASLLETARQEECLGMVSTLNGQKLALQHELLRVPPVLEHYNLTLKVGLEARDITALIKQVDEFATFVDAAYMKVR